MTRGHSGWMALLIAPRPRDLTDEQWNFIGPFVRQLPERLIGDNAYDSDRLDKELARRGVELIAPHRRTRNSGRKTVARCVATDGDGS